MIYILIAVVLAGWFVAWSLCVVAARADAQADRLLEKWIDGWSKER